MLNTITNTFPEGLRIERVQINPLDLCYADWDVNPLARHYPTDVRPFTQLEARRRGWALQGERGLSRRSTVKRVYPPPASGALWYKEVLPGGASITPSAMSICQLALQEKDIPLANECSLSPQSNILLHILEPRLIVERVLSLGGPGRMLRKW